MARRCISIMMHNGHITTESTGQELLPKEGGYIMYSNHQGKYDTLGIMYSHPRPCTVVIDAYRSKLLLRTHLLTWSRAADWINGI